MISISVMASNFIDYNGWFFAVNHSLPFIESWILVFHRLDLSNTRRKEFRNHISIICVEIESFNIQQKRQLKADNVRYCSHKLHISCESVTPKDLSSKPSQFGGWTLRRPSTK